MLLRPSTFLIHEAPPEGPDLWIAFRSDVFSTCGQGPSREAAIADLEAQLREAASVRQKAGLPPLQGGCGATPGGPPVEVSQSDFRAMARTWLKNPDIMGAAPEEMLGVDAIVVPTSPRVRMAREYLLALSICAAIACVTDWGDYRNGAVGSLVIFWSNAALAIVAGAAVAKLRMSYPGPQDLPGLTRFGLILAGAATVWVAYQFVYPLFFLFL